MQILVFEMLGEKGRNIGSNLLLKTIDISRGLTISCPNQIIEDNAPSHS